MKTRILKLVSLTFVLVMAIYCAFAFRMAENIVLSVPETGWLNLPGQPCFIQVNCNSTPSEFLCTAFYNGIQYQAFGKVNPSGLVCNKILFRPK